MQSLSSLDLFIVRFNITAICAFHALEKPLFAMFQIINALKEPIAYGDVTAAFVTCSWISVTHVSFLVIYAPIRGRYRTSFDSHISA